MRARFEAEIVQSKDTQEYIALLWSREEQEVLWSSKPNKNAEAGIVRGLAWAIRQKEPARVGILKAFARAAVSIKDTPRLF